MWLLPGGLNGWFAARDFQGLNQEHIECSHQMVLVSCDEGQSNRTLYTIYPARDDFLVAVRRPSLGLASGALPGRPGQAEITS